MKKLLSLLTILIAASCQPAIAQNIVAPCTSQTDIAGFSSCTPVTSNAPLPVTVNSNAMAGYALTSNGSGAATFQAVGTGALNPSSITTTGDITGNRLFIGSGAPLSVGSDGGLLTSGLLESTNAITLAQTTGNGILTVQGHQQSGGGSFVNLRDDTLGNYAYIGENAAIQGGTSYNQLTITNPQGSGTICVVSNGGGSATANTGCDILDDATNHIEFQNVTTGAMLCLTTTHQVGHCTAAVSCTGSACTCTCTAN